MKSFGVRLGAGLVTIIFGAYAAALAQKDKQTDTTAWSAQVPSLGEPAMPIGDDAGGSWLNESTDQAGKVMQAAANFAAPPNNFSGNNDETFGPGSIELVQHTEDMPHEDMPRNDMRSGPSMSFDAAPMPTTLSAAPPAKLQSGFSIPDDPSVDMPQSDVAYDDDDAQGGWTMPPSNDPGSNDSGSNDSGSDFPTSDLPGYDPAETRSERSLSMTFPSEAPDGQPATPATFASPQDAPEQANVPAKMPANMPAMSFNQVPDVEYFDDVAVPQSMPSPQDMNMPTAGVGSASTLGIDGRGQPPAPPAQTFSAPQAFTSPPTKLSDAVPPPRMASLPSAGYAPGLQAETFAAPQSASQIDPSTVIDAPGDRRLEGAQSPSVVIQKRAPSEVTVGKPATFVIHVQNVGAAEALDVTVQDRVPAGMRLVDASPAPVQQGSLLMWQLGALPAGDERTVTMQLVPETEGELGSVARVTFEAAASVRTISTRPELKIVQRAPEKVLIGQQLEIELEVSNPGTGEATNVSLQADVPEGLEHPKGRELDNAIGSLMPGEVRTQVLRLRAVSPGMIQNQIRLVSADGLTADHTINVEVIAPELAVELSGPSRRFLERQATYQLNVANVGTADATNVEISVQLDRGFTFVSTDYEGAYDSSRHSVFWSLANLPAGGSGSVPLTLLPVEAGERALIVDARADLGAMTKTERAVTVEGFSELSFQIINPGGPIELGAETSYEITVNNSGSKPDNNVRVQLQLPAGLELITTDGDAGTDGRGLVAFQPHAQLMPGGEFKYRVRVRGVAPGTHLVKAIVVSDHATKPVTKEESTLVYADE